MAGQDGEEDFDSLSQGPLANGEPFHIFLQDEDIIYQPSLQKPSFIGSDYRYLKGKMLGQGSYGKVKEVLDMTNLCRRGVKIMEHKRLRRIPNGEDNVRRECSILRKLSHPNIIKLIEVLESKEKKKLYMVMEFCCCNIQEMLESSPKKYFDEWQAHRYFTQLIEGVSYLHSQRVIHKDIKPSNLLLATDEVLKITDMGVAEALDLFAPDDSITTSQGSPAFQPPEIANGDDTFRGFKVDVWSCGVTLYNLVTGKYPYEGDNVFRLFENIVKGAYNIPDNLSSDLRELIKGMLMHDAKDRFSTKDIMANVWFRSHLPQTSDSVCIPALDSTDDLLRQMSTRTPLEYYVRELRGEFVDDIACFSGSPEAETPISTSLNDVHANSNVSGNANTNHTPNSEPDKVKKKKAGCILL